MKKVLMVAFCVMAVVGLAVSAQAAWYTCTIQQCGTSSGIYVLQLTDTGTTFPTPTFFMVDPSIPNAKEIYAAALTAWSSNGKVFCNIPTPTAWYPVTAIVASW